MKIFYRIILWILIIAAISNIYCFLHERNFLHFIGPFALNIALIIATLIIFKKNIDTDKKI